MQTHKNLFRIFIDPLNQAAIKYMITGSVASIIYGEPRLTHDIDLVILLTNDNIKKLAECFPGDDFYLPPEEVIRVENSRTLRGHFNIIHNETGYKADIYLMGNDPLHIWGFKNRNKLSLDGEDIWVASPEYVIVRKLAYWEEGGSEKHLSDIKSMLELQQNKISKDQILAKLNSQLQISKFIELSEQYKG